MTQFFPLHAHRSNCLCQADGTRPPDTANVSKSNTDTEADSTGGLATGAAAPAAGSSSRQVGASGGVSDNDTMPSSASSTAALDSSDRPQPRMCTTCRGRWLPVGHTKRHCPEATAGDRVPVSADALLAWQLGREATGSKVRDSRRACERSPANCTHTHSAHALRAATQRVLKFRCSEGFEERRERWCSPRKIRHGIKWAHT